MDTADLKKGENANTNVSLEKYEDLINMGSIFSLMYLQQ